MKVTFDTDPLLIGALDKIAQSRITNRTALLRDAIYEYVRAATREGKFAATAPTCGAVIEPTRMRVFAGKLVDVDEHGIRIEPEGIEQ
jgi:hypothetical protein